MLDRPVYNDLEKISQPVLVLFGENDNLIPNRYLHGGHTRDVAVPGTAKLPQASWSWCPNAGTSCSSRNPPRPTRRCWSS